MNSKTLALPLILTTIFVSCLLGVYFYQQSQINSLKTINVSPTPTPTSTLSSDMSDWKDFTSETSGFEIKFPRTFQPTEGLGHNFLNQKPVIELETKYFSYLNNQIRALLTISVKPNGKSDCEYVPRGVINTLRYKLINNINFTVFSVNGAATGHSISDTIYHFLDKNSTCYEFVTTIDEASDGNTPEVLPIINEQKTKLENQFDQILSTVILFQPPSLTPTPTVIWQTFKSDQFHFEFQYPNNMTLTKPQNGQDDFISLRFNNNNYGDDIELSISPNPSKQNIFDFYGNTRTSQSGDPVFTLFDQNGQKNSQIIYKKTASGETIYQLNNTYCVDRCRRATFSKDKYIYLIRGFEYDETIKVFDRILSTFKFTN